METLPSSSQTSCPSLYPTKSAVANSCFPLRLLIVSKQKGQGYIKRKFEPETEKEQQKQAKLFHIFCTKETSELQGKKYAAHNDRDKSTITTYGERYGNNKR